MSLPSKLRRLSARRVRLFRDAFLLLSLVRLGLGWIPVRTLQRRIARRRPSQGATPSWSQGEVIGAICLMSKGLPGMTCLVRAMAAAELLARSGHTASVVIGAMKEGGELKAHAWVTEGDRVIMGGPVGQYAPLYSMRVG